MVLQHKQLVIVTLAVALHHNRTVLGSVVRCCITLRHAVLYCGVLYGSALHVFVFLDNIVNMVILMMDLMRYSLQDHLELLKIKIATCLRFMLQGGSLTEREWRPFPATHFNNSTKDVLIGELTDTGCPFIWSTR